MRPSWNTYFLDIARVVATRSTCLRAQHGSVIIDKHNRVLSTGYNNAPAGQAHCSEAGCRLVKDDNGTDHCIRTFHAEANALRYLPIDAQPAKIYITGTPCLDCLKNILRSGIKSIICAKAYGELTTYHKRLLEVFGASIEILDVPNN